MNERIAENLNWIDVHTHLNFLDVTPEVAIAEGKKLGVKRFFTIGTEPEDHEIVLGLAQKYYPEVMCTLGIHPHEAQKFDAKVEAFILQYAPQKEVVAVGEIGLDYFYSHSPHEVQRAAFRRQLELAEQLNLPVEIHTREAEDDTIEILKELRGRVRGLIHCFTGTQKLADAALDLGFDISISGVVTFKKAQELKDVVKTLPIDRIHVETDAPFLAPMPHRGKKNVPAYVFHTAQVVAELLGVSQEKLSEQTQVNARRLFSKLQAI